MGNLQARPGSVSSWDPVSEAMFFLSLLLLGLHGMYQHIQLSFHESSLLYSGGHAIPTGLVPISRLRPRGANATGPAHAPNFRLTPKAGARIPNQKSSSPHRSQQYCNSIPIHARRHLPVSLSPSFSAPLQNKIPGERSILSKMRGIGMARNTTIR